MNALVSVTSTFDAAHHLPGYKGKCRNVHGHTYTVRLSVYGQLNQKSGMVYDMSYLKTLLNSLLETYDHHNLNDFIKNPTAENIAYALLRRIQQNLVGDGSLQLRVWETPDCFVEVSGSL